MVIWTFRDLNFAMEKTWGVSSRGRSRHDQNDKSGSKNNDSLPNAQDFGRL
ncbi:hypothetical protein [Salinicola corii]|uniref:hypothetical protein n=1 Tax=Salinicola corii TaxID=2606937 RepID=UPI001659663E|nr:hypothetical protein [Salinicola corii]